MINFIEKFISIKQLINLTLIRNTISFPLTTSWEIVLCHLGLSFSHFFDKLGNFHLEKQCYFRGNFKANSITAITSKGSEIWMDKIHSVGNDVT